MTTVPLRGSKAGEVYGGQARFGVVAWGVPGVRNDIAALLTLPADAPTGVQVRLRDLADALVVPELNESERGAASRRLDITCNVAPGRDPGRGAAGADAKRALSYGQGHHPESLGEFAARQASTRSFYGPGLLALLGIVPAIDSDFASLRLTRIAAFTPPSALAVGVHLTGGVSSLGSLVGFVTVLGIAARNGIVLVSRYRHLDDEEGEPSARVWCVPAPENAPCRS